MITVQEFKAVGDGKKSATAVIQKAIDEAASAEGSGHVQVPPGLYLTGTLFMKSNLKFELLPGAVLKAIEDPSEYPDLPRRDEFPKHLVKGESHKHFIFADTSENLTICGGGAFDGNRQGFTPGWDDLKPFKWTGASKRPFNPMFDFFKCSNLVLENFTIQNSPGWTCHVCMCDNVRVHGLKVKTYVYGGGSDGFDIDGCRDVFFSDCNIETGDDCIVMKSFPDTRSCERIVITNCVLKTECAAVKIGTESWHDFRKIVFSDSVVYDSSRAFQITCFDGAVVEDILLSNITCDTNSANQFNRPIHIDLAQRHTGFLPGITEKTTPKAGEVRRISISDFTAVTDGRLIFTACPGRKLRDISLRDIRLEYPWIEDPEIAGSCDGLQCSFSCPDARIGNGAVVIENAENFIIDGLSIRWPENPPEESFLPKYSNGELIRDPRKDFTPIPKMSVLWKKNAKVDLQNIKAEDYPGSR